MTRISLVEDDQRISGPLHRALTGRGYHVQVAADGLGGLRSLIDERPDALVLDLGLPDVDGLELVRMMRAVSEVPIIAATARDDERDIIATLNAGADDYVVKPYSAEHLEARIVAVLRRSRPDETTAIVVGGLVIDIAARTATLDGVALELSRKEYDLLAHLASQAGRVVSKRQLLAAVWDQPYGGADKTVDVHLSWLRRKLGETAAEPRYLHVVRAVGVKLVDPNR